MISEHEFNTKWWGKPVGIVTDPAFFSLSIDDQHKALSPYAWAEFRSALSSAPSPERLSGTGFFQADTQINFRINLRHVPSSQSLEDLEVRFADDKLFAISIGEPAHFENERFLLLPKSTQEMIDMRYVMWANDLIKEDRSRCLQVLRDGKVMGWFLSRHTERGINLTLAMLKRGAQLSGQLLYQKALVAYCQRGDHIGWASFSVTNTAVLNIYSGLGARFLPPDGNWLWIQPMS
jgi:hypothetical protein